MDKIFRTTRNLIDTSRKDKNQKAEKIGIILVFLPIYSPGLNPLEQIWICVKKSVSKGFIKSEEYLKEMTSGKFIKLVKSKSFAKRLLEKLGE